jgi:hypothetical protein
MNKQHVFAVSTVILLLGTTPAQANPILPDLYARSGDEDLFLLIASSCLLLECLVVRWLLRPWVKLRHILLAFVLIHVVSFPLTAILGFMFEWFAELFPLAIEPRMYSYFGSIGRKVPNLQARIIGANLTSFVAGVAAYHMILALM